MFTEPFSDWLEEKIELPIFEELPVPDNGHLKSTPYNEVIKISHPDDTQTLLQEFETVLGDVEACHQIVPSSTSTLTPPQSPPPHKPLSVDTQLLVTLQPVQPLYQNHQSMYDVVIPEEKCYINEVPVQWNTKNISLDRSCPRFLKKINMNPKKNLSESEKVSIINNANFPSLRTKNFAAEPKPLAKNLRK